MGMQESARESAFQVLLNLQGELSDKVGTALQIAASVKSDLLGSSPGCESETAKQPEVFSGTVGSLIQSSRRTLGHVATLTRHLEELRAEIPRDDRPKIAGPALPVYR